MCSRVVQVPLQVSHSICQEQLVWSKGLATEHLEDKARRPSKETSALREAGRSSNIPPTSSIHCSAQETQERRLAITSPSLTCYRRGYLAPLQSPGPTAGG